MTDIGNTIAPKSDQLNADDLINGPRTVKVTGVRILGEADQPVAIHYEGENGRPYKPCKSMRRVMVALWGGDGKLYTGRSMTLFRDPTVAFGGAQVGGIRISHMSHIDKTQTMALTASRANRKPYTVKPLIAAQDAPEFDADAFVSAVELRATEATEAGPLKAWWDSAETTESRKRLLKYDQDKSARARQVIADRLGELEAGSEV